MMIHLSRIKPKLIFKNALRRRKSTAHIKLHVHVTKHHIIGTKQGN